MIQNARNDAGLSSTDEKLKANVDGSVDIYLGPTVPAGGDSNWIQTLPGKGFFIWFRAFGPTEPFFDKTWTLPDIERV